MQKLKILSKMVKFVLILALLGLACNKETETPIQIGNYLLIVNTLSETVSIYDIDKDTLYVDVFETGKTPNDLLINGNLGVIVNSGFQGIPALDIIDLANMTYLRRAYLPTGSNPYAICYYNNKYFVTLASVNKVLVLNSNFLPEDSIPVGKWPEGITAYNNHIYVAVTGFDINTYSYGDGYLYKIDLSQRPYAIDSLKVGKNPQWVKLFDNKIFVMCTGDYSGETGAFYIVNPATFTIDDSIKVNFYPQDFVYYKGKIYFTDFGMGIFSISLQRELDTLFIINGASRIILDGSTIWISVFRSNDENLILFKDVDSEDFLEIEVGQAKGVGPLGIYKKFQ